MQNPVSRPPVGAVLALAVLAASFSSIFIRFAQLFLALHFGTWITSLEYTSVASSVVLVQTAPLMVAVLSPLLLGEQISRYLIAGLLIAMLGSLIVGISDACGPEGCLQLNELLQGTAIRGDLLALAGAAAGAGYVLVGRRVRQSVSLVPYIGIAYGAAAVALIVAAVFQLVAHTSYNWALGYVAAAVVSLVLLAEPVASGILALVILDETPTTLRLVGGALILFGIGLGTLRTNPSLSES
jgi:drug/metabolite transporter (DMT)-like permease